MSFQPTITTQAAACYVAVGDRLVDQVSVGVQADLWVIVGGHPIVLVALGTL